VHVDDMRRLLTLTEGRIRRAWLAMVEHLREENSVAAIAGRIYHLDPLAGLDLAIGKFTAEEHAAYIAAGQRTARWLNGEFRKASVVNKKLAAFDPVDPHSVRWARENSLDKLRELTDDQRGAIREILTAGARSGDNPLVMAREIRDSIGLTQQQAAIVENYRRQLEGRQFGAAIQRELSDGRFDRTIAAAARDARGLTAAQIDAMVERYRQNWVAFRAETIARTEGLRVAHQGTEELYRQAIASGDIEASQIERTWNHSPSKGQGRKGKGKGKGGPRSFHVSMDGQIRGYGEAFVSGLGAELRFPGDPEASAEETANCRCALSTRLLAGSAARGMPQVPALAEDAAEAVDVGEAAAAAAEEEAALAAEAEVDAGEPVEPLPEFPEPSPPPSGYRSQAEQQQMQRARQRLEAAQAQAEQAAAELEAARREVDGFRIGVGAIGDEAGIAEGEVAPAVPPAAAPIVTAPAEFGGDPYRTAAPPRSSDVPTLSDKPAPLGYEAWDYNGETYYRHALREDAPYYTQSQVGAITSGRPLIGDDDILRGPNEQFPGFTAVDRDGRVAYLPKETADSVYHAYTRDQVVSGEAVADEKWLADAAARAAKKPGLLARVRRLIWPG
jgi:hypothetical protein